jgi:hypothetical protein
VFEKHFLLPALSGGETRISEEKQQFDASK